MNKVRFAPSPTGHLHLGTARTAVMNWLFARRYDGTMVLRIEDTDVERSSASFEQAIIDDLKWLGLDWAEGPDVGGPSGAYRQSERADLYRAAAERLRSSGHAYDCYCTPEELEESRKRMLAVGKMPKYDGRCLALSDAEREELAAGREPALRFHVPRGDIVVLDMLRGEITFPSEAVGDFIITRSEGTPAYNFAAVVDDSEMQVTHIIRGEDHLSNSARQTLIYRALGSEIPHLLHLGMVLGPDSSKLSKRHGAKSIDEYRREGYLATAILNYLAILGWSDPAGEEVFEPDELAGRFTWERLSKSGVIFDPAKLLWLNGRHIRSLAVSALAEQTMPLFPEGLSAKATKEWWQLFFEAVHDSITTLTEAAPVARIFLEEVTYPPEAREAFNDGLAQRALREMLARVEGATGLGVRGKGAVVREHEPVDAWKELLNQVKHEFKEQGASPRKVLLPLRFALTGRTAGPELQYCLALLGVDEVIERLKAALAFAREAV